MKKTKTEITPEWVGHEDARAMFGINRGHLYLLTEQGQIKSVSLRGHGTKRGRRLWSVESIRAFIHSAMQGGQ